MSREGVNKGVKVLVVLIGTIVVALGASLVAAFRPWAVRATGLNRHSQLRKCLKGGQWGRLSARE